MKIAKNKILHFTASLLIFIVIAILFFKFTFLNPFVFGSIITLLIGIVKEIYDIPRKGFSTDELVVDILGIIAGMILFQITLLIIL